MGEELLPLPHREEVRLSDEMLRRMFTKSLLDKEPRLDTIWRKGLREANGHDPQMASPCKHPRVRIVSRQDDVEYVECVECGEVFDSEEFRDMEIEEKGLDRVEELDE